MLEFSQQIVEVDELGLKKYMKLAHKSQGAMVLARIAQAQQARTRTSKKPEFCEHLNSWG
jgi:hypothetical protein